MGGRTKEDWLAALYDMDSRLDSSYPSPLIVSDNWDPIKDAVTEVYGIEYFPVHDGRGRPYSKSRFAVRPDLKYAQVIKVKDEHGHVKRIYRRIVYGDPVNVKASLILSSMNSLNTSYVERQNLSFRNAAKRLVRETICFSKNEQYLNSYLEILQAWFNFIKLHKGLTIKEKEKHHIHRTPAMAQELASKPLTWKEILRWKHN